MTCLKISSECEITNSALFLFELNTLYCLLFKTAIQSSLCERKSPRQPELPSDFSLPNLCIFKSNLSDKVPAVLVYRRMLRLWTALECQLFPASVYFYRWLACSHASMQNIHMLEVNCASLCAVYCLLKCTTKISTYSEGQQPQCKTEAILTYLLL